ncbi:protein regulator of cytokinesis 1-like isoform X1 [Bombus pascuorum]|uniref:protein regulator of cytokinesis 1-like isoform X1 n=2 Tax=Bombus pascuorum TaxID=65598 RepID=UPI00298D96E5|nr:protein regulator of cytokinesis 1-like isoform X1 [Bombus pascuorum]
MADSSEWEPLMQKITAKLSSTLTQLHQIWEEIGYNHEVRSIYCKQVFDHIEDLLGDMVSESKLKKETILVNVKNLMDQIGVLTKELGTNITNAGYENLSLKEVEEALRADLQNLQYCKTQRVTHLKKLLAKEKSLCKVLGTQPINIEEKLPSEEELKSFELYLEKQEGEKCRLEAIFNEQRRAIVRMMDDLGTSPSSSFQHIVYEDDENYVFSNSNMSKLKELREELEHKVNSAKEHVEDIRQELIALWKYLNEPEHICQSFLSSYQGYSVATINALTTELERCKEKRKQNIAKYVSQVRSELVKLWDLCKFSEQQRKEFIYFYSHTYTEDLLTLHELEVKRIQEFYDSNKSIYELLQERDDLWTKMKELLQRANNPDRFYNRGGQLLMEEKERKTIQKKLPKIEEQLRNLIKEYENMHEEIFTINGMSVEELLKESWEHLNEEKESIKKARKEGKDKSAKKATPIVSKIPSKLALSSSKKFSIRRHTPLNFSKRKLFCSPSPNTSAKRRNKSIGASGSKSKRNSKGTSSKKGLKQKNQNENSMLQSSTATDTTYSKFEEHLEDKKELRSSLLPEKVLANASKPRSKSRRRSIRTPAKPLRKNLPLPKTPTTSESSQLQLHKSPRSPRIAQSSRLATISTPLPIIF